jgi:hypothetical protein
MRSPNGSNLLKSRDARTPAERLIHFRESGDAGGALVPM